MYSLKIMASVCRPRETSAGQWDVCSLVFLVLICCLGCPPFSFGYSSHFMRRWIVLPVSLCERLNSGAGVILILRLRAFLLCYFILGSRGASISGFNSELPPFPSAILPVPDKFTMAAEGNGSRKILSFQLRLFHFVSCCAGHSTPNVF